MNEKAPHLWLELLVSQQQDADGAACHFREAFRLPIFPFERLFILQVASSITIFGLSGIVNLQNHQRQDADRRENGPGNH